MAGFRARAPRRTPARARDGKIHGLRTPRHEKSRDAAGVENPSDWHVLRPPVESPQLNPPVLTCGVPLEGKLSAGTDGRVGTEAGGTAACARSVTGLCVASGSRRLRAGCAELEPLITAPLALEEKLFVVSVAPSFVHGPSGLQSRLGAISRASRPRCASLVMGLYPWWRPSSRSRITLVRDILFITRALYSCSFSCARA